MHVLRFRASAKPGDYPFVCTFPGLWVIMKGQMVVANDLADVEQMLRAAKPKIVKEWKMSDFDILSIRKDETSVMRDMQAFVKARCNQCHVHTGHGTNLGPNLTEIEKQFQGKKLLRHLLEPSHEINKKYRTWQFVTKEGKFITGFIRSEDENSIHVIPNLLTPKVEVVISQREIELRKASSISSIPSGLLNVLTKKEIENLVAFLQAGGYKTPAHLRKKHSHEHHNP